MDISFPEENEVEKRVDSVQKLPKLALAIDSTPRPIGQVA